MSIEVYVAPPKDREIMIRCGMQTMAEIYEATRPGRRTRKQQQTLEALGDAILSTMPELEDWLSDADDQFPDGDSGVLPEPE